VSHCYLPSIMCVTTSWFGFWIKLEIAPARVTLGIATFFTMSQMSQTFAAGLPKLSYVKLIDIWMIACKVFVFGTLFEYCVAQVRQCRVHPRFLEISPKLGVSFLHQFFFHPNFFRSIFVS